MTSFYITTPIYYVNDKPHIGHAYTTIAADALARFKRLQGYEVFFLTGTDEHGQKVEQSAAKAGVTPQAFADTVSQTFRALAQDVNASPDDFIRTTEPRHYRTVQALWQKLVDNGQIYESQYEGWYSVRDECFYQESELVDGKAPTGASVEWVAEPSYFFKLSDWQQPLLDYYAAHPDAIAPRSRANEVLRFIEGGLKDLSVSRTTFAWGVPVPNNPKHIMYVWLDALANYLTVLGYPDTTPAMQRFWPASVHIVGKDILRFHAVYWPAFLMAADLPPPQRVFAHGWWTNDGQKISKSVGNVIDPYALIQQYGLDAMRYFMLRDVPFGSDGDFSHSAMVRRVNTDLANDLGNLCQRVVSMVHKHVDGRTPTADLQADDKTLLAQAYGVRALIIQSMDTQALHTALEQLWQVIGEGNRYVDAQAPWALRKTDMVRMATVLYTVMETLRVVVIPLQAFMPESATKMLDILGVPREQRGIEHMQSTYALASGTSLPPLTPVFPRYVEG